MSFRACRAALVSALVSALVLAACDTGDGRTLRPPPPGATAPTSTTTTLAAGATTAAPGAVLGTTGASGMTLSSPEFADGGPFPAQYAACGGDNISPPLQWSGVPTGTVELALVVDDVDAPDGSFIHWVVAGLSPTLIGLGPGAVPEGAIEARNDTSEFGWFGPCPPDDETHRYVFTLYALSEPSGVTQGAGGPAAIQAITTKPGFAATLSVTYAVPPE